MEFSGRKCSIPNPRQILIQIQTPITIPILIPNLVPPLFSYSEKFEFPSLLWSRWEVHSFHKHRKTKAFQNFWWEVYLFHSTEQRLLCFPKESQTNLSRQNGEWRIHVARIMLWKGDWLAIQLWENFVLCIAQSGSLKVEIQIQTGWNIKTKQVYESQILSLITKEFNSQQPGIGI